MVQVLGSLGNTCLGLKRGVVFEVRPCYVNNYGRRNREKCVPGFLKINFNKRFIIVRQPSNKVSLQLLCISAMDMGCTFLLFDIFCI